MKKTVYRLFRYDGVIHNQNMLGLDDFNRVIGRCNVVNIVDIRSFQHHNIYSMTVLAEIEEEDTSTETRIPEFSGTL